MKYRTRLLTSALLGLLSLAFIMAGMLTSPPNTTSIIMGIAFAILGVILVRAKADSPDTTRE